MFDVADFLDRAKAAAGVTSDYALAVKVLGYKRASTVTNWRTGYSMPDDAAVLRLCALTGDDPAHVAATLQAMRATTAEAAALWRQVAARLATAKIAVLAAIVFVAQFFGGTDALAMPAPVAQTVNFAIIVFIFGIALGSIRRLAEALFLRLGRAMRGNP